MVTSSAVVGSSAISSLRIAGDRHGDHHALVHAARQLVRKGCARAALRIRNADLPSAARWRARACACLLPPSCMRSASDLEADGEARVEAGHRLLEDHRDVLADDRRRARRTSPAGRGRRRSDGRRDLAGIGEQAHQRQHGHDLPEPDSPTMPRTSPASTSGRRRRRRGTPPRAWEFDRERLRISSRAISAPPQLGVERVAQAVAHQVDRQHGDQDGEAGKVTIHQARWMNSRANRPASCPIRASAAARRGRGSRAPPRRGWRRRSRASPARSAAPGSSAARSSNISRRVPAPAMRAATT
jgi:hypothetical protein